jgi:hypothetical protein
MSHQARYRDIVALLARGVLRVKKQPVVTKAIESPIPAEQDVSNLPANHVNNESDTSQDQMQHGGNQ